MLWKLKIFAFLYLYLFVFASTQTPRHSPNIESKDFEADNAMKVSKVNGERNSQDDKEGCQAENGAPFVSSKERFLGYLSYKQWCRFVIFLLIFVNLSIVEFWHILVLKKEVCYHRIKVLKTSFVFLIPGVPTSSFQFWRI